MAPGIILDPSHQKTTVTVEAERVYHYISDEELELLVHTEESIFTKVVWAAIGVFFGALQGAVAAVSKMGRLGWEDIVPVCLLIASIAAFAVSLLGERLRSRRVRRAQERIRARHKVPVHTMTALDHPSTP